MDFGAEQVKKRLMHHEGTIDPESLPAFYDGYQDGLTVANHPSLGRVEGIRTGNTSIVPGDPMPILLTEGLPRFPATTIESALVADDNKKRYFLTYFYEFTVSYGDNIFFNMGLTDWQKRSKFLQDGEIIDQQSLSRSIPGVSVTATQNGVRLNINISLKLTPNMPYFAGRDPDNPKFITGRGMLEAWSSVSTVFVARGVTKYINNQPTTSTFAGGNPSTRRRDGTLQPNNRWRGTINNLPVYPILDNSWVFLSDGITTEIGLCVFPAILPDKPDLILVGPDNYFYPDACR